MKQKTLKNREVLYCATGIVNKTTRVSYRKAIRFGNLLPGMAVLFALMLTSAFPVSLKAQEEAEESSVSAISFDAGMDIFSSYVWRGSKFGTGPAFQPFVEMTAGGFTFGGWGSISSGGVEDLEMDLYLSYDLDFGLSVGLTDYYFGNPYFTFDDKVSSHAIEANLGYEISGVSVGANYFINNSEDGAGAGAGDMYFELGYSFPQFGVAVGAGDGWHTTTGEFEVCNISISTEKEIEITDRFSLPLSGSVILNPQTEQFYVVVGISF